MARCERASASNCQESSATGAVAGNSIPIEELARAGEMSRWTQTGSGFCARSPSGAQGNDDREIDGTWHSPRPKGSEGSVRSWPPSRPEGSPGTVRHGAAPDRAMGTVAVVAPPVRANRRGCGPNCSTRSRSGRRSPAAPPTAPSTRAGAMTPSPPAGLVRSVQSRRNGKPWRPDTPGAVARNETPTSVTAHRAGHLAMIERLSAPERRRDQDALAGSLEPVAFTGSM